MQKDGSHTDTMPLEEYYKNPIVESFTYVSMGMDNLTYRDPKGYAEIKEKQAILLQELDEVREGIKRDARKLGFSSSQIDAYIDQFLQKFPLAMRKLTAWDDVNFFLLYMLAKALKPKVVIETGCNVGFSSAFIALALKENGNGCKFYTVDISEVLANGWEDIGFVALNNIRKQNINFQKLNSMQSPRALSLVPHDLREHIVFFRGFSKDILPNLLEETEEVDIFFHDSEHSYRNIVWECKAVLPYIKHGGYLLAHDVNLNSAFRNMFGRKGGIIVGNFNLGVFQKVDTGSDFINIHCAPPLDNAKLNDEEFLSKNIRLDSFPKKIVLRIEGGCGLKCVFCSGGYKREAFDVPGSMQQVEDKFSQAFSQAESFFLIFYGHSIQLPKPQDLARGLLESFPEADRTFCLHGEYLTQEVNQFFVERWGRYHYLSKNFIQIILPGSNEHFYKIMTGSDNFHNVENHIKHLNSKRLDRNDIQLHLIFIVTAFNIENLPDFVRWAKDIGVDGVICHYANICHPEQKYISCFFVQELTNRIFDEAEALAEQMNIKLVLPPRFGQKQYPEPGVCRVPFSQIICDTQGHIFPCEAIRDYSEILSNEKDISEIWNGSYWKKLRSSLIDDTSFCARHCLRANPSSVNDVKSHFIYCRDSIRDKD